MPDLLPSAPSTAPVPTPFSRSSGRDGVTHTWDDEAPIEERFARQLHYLNEIGLALSSERDINALLEKILSASRELTGADAGSLFLVQTDKEGNSALYFREAQNDSIAVSTKMTVAVGPSSLAGYVALTGQPLCFEDVYCLPSSAPYQFNPAFDRKNGYRTQSLLVVPLRNRSDEIVGVLQLINRKRHRDANLCEPDVQEREVIPFDEESLDLAASIASQAAVAIENIRLLADIEELFESFVQAASSAIEDRDPSTSGHSRRVTALTLALARAVNQTQEGRFGEIHFSSAALKELRYAGLLHDFGKIGVRESVLTKSHKLDFHHFEWVKARLALYRQTEKHAGRDVSALDEMARRLQKANDPVVTYLPDPEYAQLCESLDVLLALRYEDASGQMQPVLTPEESDALRIRRGSLTPAEYRQIQQHAALSYDFLKQINWTKDLSRVADIAYCHHEKLGGGGYPRGIMGDAIPLQARLMTVADIYDALTASDRPYKRAMPVERALHILREEAKSGALDNDVVELFIARHIWKLTTPGETVAPDFAEEAQLASAKRG